MLFSHLRLAWSSLSSHGFRSLLTVLSVAVGCFGIVAMTSLAESGITSLAKSLEELGGARMVMFVSKEPEREKVRGESYQTGLDRGDRDRVFSGVAGVESVALGATLGQREARSDENRASVTDLVAADPGFFELYRMRIAQGRSFDFSDEAKALPVCVVGHIAAKKLWNGSPIGHWLTIGGLRCRVIGLFADNDRFGVRFGFDWTDLVVVPHSFALTAMPGGPAGVVDPDPNEHAGAKRIREARRSTRASRPVIMASTISRSMTFRRP